MKTVRVLIVDDMPKVRIELTNLLQLAGKKSVPPIEVIGEARDGQDAYQRTLELHPDVILMDLEMPVMDGFEATRRIKASFPGIRVIIFSIHTSPEAADRARAAGADVYLVKGAGIRQLIACILNENGV